MLLVDLENLSDSVDGEGALKPRDMVLLFVEHLFCDKKQSKKNTNTLEILANEND